MKSWFKSIENSKTGTTFTIEEVIKNITFDEKGLLPVICQDYESKEVLMFAWMNREALMETLSTGKMCYWSRSRKSLWRKGESSGHWQTVKTLRLDCDGDVLLAQVEQTGAACHTHRRSCFYLNIDEGNVVIDPL